MARNKEPAIIHPLAATEALTAFNRDVGMLAAAVESALSFISDRALDGRKACDVVAPSLRENLDRVRRWYETIP